MNASKMEKYNPSLAAAKLDIVNERIDQQMCQLFHTEVLKKFSHDSQTEGKINCYIKLNNFVYTLFSTIRNSASFCAQQSQGAKVFCVSCV